MKDIKNRNLTNIRAYKEDAKKMNELAYELTGIEKCSVKVPEVIRRINNSDEIKKLLKKDSFYYKRPKNLSKKGGLSSLITMGFVLGIIVVIFFILSLMLPVTQSTFGGITGNLKQITPSLYKVDNQTGGTPTNVTNQVDTTLDTANGVIQASGWLPYTALVALFVLFIILAIQVRAYPYLMIIWIGIVIVLVYLTMIFSNSYETQVALNPVMYSTQDSLTGFLNTNLPIVMALFGFLGGVFMFLVIKSEPEYEVSQQ